MGHIKEGCGKDGTGMGCGDGPARKGWGGSDQGALLARRTRTVKLCSFDARSKGQPWPLPLRKWKTRWEGKSI